MTKKKSEQKLTLDGEYNRLKNLVQFKNKDNSFIEKVAQKNLWIKQINLGSRFSNSKDVKLSEEIFQDYLNNYEINTFNDAQKTADLCFKIVLKTRTQEAIAKIIADDTNKLVPERQLSCLHDLEKDIVELEKVLGISCEKEQDALNALEELKKKFQTYIVFNRNEFTLMAPYICSKCGTEGVQPLLLRRNISDFNVLRHPYLMGRYLWNTEVQNDYRDGKITKEMAARYQKTSPQMIEWMHENRYKILDIENVPKEEVNEFIDKCPYLPSSDELTEK